MKKMKTNPFEGMPLPRSDSDSDLSAHGQNENEDGMGNPPGTPVSGVLLRAPGEYSSDSEMRERELATLHLEKIEEDNLKAIEKLTERTGMPITQENGQRRYGPPLNCDEDQVPPRGTEVFVGKLPRDCYEPELVPVFEQAGRIYELRLMMDFSGTNRGYCFVQYFTPEEADRAVSELNNYEIRSGRCIGVVKSVDNCRLFFSHIPYDKTEEEIFYEVDKVADGVVKVTVITGENKRNKGYAFVEFESHKAAAMAKRKLMNGKIHMWGRDIAVDWADPLDEDCQPNSSSSSGTRSRKTKTEGPPPHRRRNQIPRFQNNNQHLQGGNYAHPYVNGTGQFGFNQSVTWSIQQHGVVHPGVMQLSTLPMNQLNHQFPSNVFPGFHAQKATMNVSSKPCWYGIPGVPLNIYFGQWQQQPPPEVCQPQFGFQGGMQ